MRLKPRGRLVKRITCPYTNINVQVAGASRRSREPCPAGTKIRFVLNAELNPGEFYLSLRLILKERVGKLTIISVVNN